MEECKPSCVAGSFGSNVCEPEKWVLQEGKQALQASCKEGACCMLACIKMVAGSLLSESLALFVSKIMHISFLRQVFSCHSAGRH